MKNQIKEIFGAEQITLTDRQCEQFSTFSDFLVEYNKKVNLTAITEPREIIIKHFLDSVLPIIYVDEVKNIADIGSGAGFPGVPMAIYRPNTKVVLIEANGKKVTFLNELIRKLDLKNVSVIVGRAEDLSRGELRESFEIVTARAFAPFAQLVEYTMPFLELAGSLLVMKGGSEIYEDSAAAVEALGGDLEAMLEYELPGGDERRLFVIEKLSRTPKKYPRSNALIKKSPIR
jgi:16S rRNA (guanine527-N7)-methyltransferase